MDWSPDQEMALKRIDEWIRERTSPRFSLGGYAGTGKTTLARHIAENHGGDVRFAAFTGKAASVLRSKGCMGATTIHKLIYQPKGDTGAAELNEIYKLIDDEEDSDDPDQSKIRAWRRDVDRLKREQSAMFEKKHSDESEIKGADLVIIDESSMVDRRMGSDLESYGVPVLYLGDPGQLPPVRGKAHLGPDEYDFVLEQIHRQAAESPIIWLASQIRNGESVKFGSHGDGLVTIQSKKEWDMELVCAADQVLTGSNASRFAITRQMRKFMKYGQVFPLKGDKLICRKNDHELGILNGVGCKALDDCVISRPNLILPVEYDGKVIDDKMCDLGYFEEHYSGRTVPVSNKPGDVMHLDYGYCITGHKSQGSQWNHVVIADDKMRIQDRAQRRKWLYTVVTRAEERLTYYV